MPKPSDGKKLKPRGRPFSSGPANEGRRTQFRKGQSGNPGGQPKNPFPALIRRETNDGEEIVRRVLGVLRRPRSQRMLMWAAEFLRDTGWHKPVQGLRGMDDDGNDAPIRIAYELVEPTKMEDRSV